MGIVRLSLVVLKTREVDSLRRFYNALGVELTEEQHGKGPLHFAGPVGDVVLELYPLPEKSTPTDATTRLGANRQRIVEPEGAFNRQRMYTKHVGSSRQQP